MDGVKKQIESVKDYSSLTEEKLKQIIEDVMFKGDIDKGEPPIFKPLPEGFDLDDMIKDGFMYSTEGAIKLWTGSGGIRNIIKASREAGIPDYWIAQDIYVADYSKGTSGGGYWIGEVIWTPIEKEDGTKV